MKIRPARVPDIPAITELSEEFWKTTPYEDEFDPDSASAMADECIQAGIMLVVEDAGRIEGFACALVGGLLGNRNVKVATEVAYYLRESARRAGVGKLLLMTLESVARVAGCRYMNMAMIHDAGQDNVPKLYESFGYRKRETLFIKEL